MKQATVIRLFLIGLPLGLIVLGGASLLIHTGQPAENGPPPTVLRLARETVTTERLEDYLRALSQTIGPRHAGEHADKMTIAGNYIESTIGPLNMGYEVTRRAVGTGEGTVDNLIITVPGGKLVHETVVVAAHYDSAPGSPGANRNGTGVAALFALAETFVAQRPDRSLRMVFLANGAEPFGGTAESGAAAFVRRERDANARLVAAICLDGLGSFPEGEIAFAEPLDDYFPADGNFLAVVAPPVAAELVRKLTEGSGGELSFTVRGALIDRDAETVFGSTTAAAFLEADIPCVLMRSGGSFPLIAGPSGRDDLSAVDLAKFTDAVQVLISACHGLLNPRSS